MTQTDKCTMFLNFKHKYCENDYITQSSPQIQCKPYQITNGIFFTELEQKNLWFVWKHKNLNSQSNFYKKKKKKKKKTEP